MTLSLILGPRLAQISPQKLVEKPQLELTQFSFFGIYKKQHLKTLKFT